MKDQKTIILAGAAALIIGAGSGYYIGTHNFFNRNEANWGPGNFGRTGYGMMGQNFNGRGNGSQTGNQAGNFNGTGRGNMMGNRPISGTILSVSDNSITVQQPDGSSRIVILSDQTSINEATKVDRSQLTKDAEVAVFGSLNSDGSLTAQSIELNPEFRGRNTQTATPAPTK